jgi:hypothetical protein
MAKDQVLLDSYGDPVHTCFSKANSYTILDVPLSSRWLLCVHSLFPWSDLHTQDSVISLVSFSNKVR